MDDVDHFGWVGQELLSIEIPDNIPCPVYNIPNHVCISDPAYNFPDQVYNIYGPIPDHTYTIPDSV